MRSRLSYPALALCTFLVFVSLMFSSGLLKCVKQYAQSEWVSDAGDDACLYCEAEEETEDIEYLQVVQEDFSTSLQFSPYSVYISSSGSYVVKFGKPPTV